MTPDLSRCIMYVELSEMRKGTEMKNSKRQAESLRAKRGEMARTLSANFAAHMAKQAETEAKPAKGSTKREK